MRNEMNEGVNAEPRLIDGRAVLLCLLVMTECDARKTMDDTSGAIHI